MYSVSNTFKLLLDGCGRVMILETFSLLLISYVLCFLQRSAQKGKTQPTVTEYIKQHELPTDK